MNVRILVAVAALALLLTGCSRGPGPATRILLVTFDTTRADRLGCYGNEDRLTPNLDRLAAEATLFEHAVAQVPTTLPSHSTMFTGLYPQDHGVRYNLMFRLGPEAHTLAEIVSEAGFATAAFPGSYILDRKYGLAQGFDTFADPPTLERGMRSHPDDLLRNAAEGVDLALDWLAGHRGEKSFVWLHFWEPHHPYEPPFPYSSRYRERPYDGEIAYADEQFGRLYDSLRGDGEWDRTLLVVAGDHGEGLHDHDESYHSYLVYETTQRVPLILRAPRVAASRVSEPVVLADLMPTLLDLAGLPVPEGLRGISLRPALDGGDLPRRDLYFESLAGSLNYGWAELRGVRSGRWKLIDSSDPELYDLEEDPEERINLAGLEAERVQDLRAALAAVADPLAAEAPAQQAQEAVLDAETQLFLASLGYVGSVAGGGSAADAAQPRAVIDMANELLRAQRAVALRQWDAVLDLSDYVRRRDPKNKWALQNGARALIALDRAREAQDLGAEVVRYYPEMDQAYVIWAIAYRAQDQTETAWKVLHQGLKAIPGSEVLTYFAVVAAFDAGHADVCGAELPAALAAHPDSGRLIVLEARCQAEAGDPHAALATLARAGEAGFGQFDLLKQAEEFREVVALPGWESLVAESAASREKEP